MAVGTEIRKLVLLNEEKVESGLRADGETHTSTDVWYFDNGASNHMSGERSKFHDLDDFIQGHVRFGDGSTVKTEGKGTVVF